MANDNFTQFALANDQTFRRRLKASLARIAFQILTESTGTANHAVRKAYALQVLTNPDQAVSNLAGIFVFRTNLFSTTTSVAFDGFGGTVVQSAVTDAAMDSQLATDWDSLSGV
jgi:hypothetical protein